MLFGLSCLMKVRDIDPDQATQQNAALIEQSTAASEGLRQRAAHLVQAVAVFDLA